MAKAAKQSSDAEPTVDQPLTDRERLAMAIFTKLAGTNLTTSKTLEHIAATAFDHTAAFFAELETRRSLAQTTAIEFASAAAPSPQGAANGQ